MCLSMPSRARILLAISLIAVLRSVLDWNVLAAEDLVGQRELVPAPVDLGAKGARLASSRASGALTRLTNT
jgi:hypothetical protein